MAIKWTLQLQFAHILHRIYPRRALCRWRRGAEWLKMLIYSLMWWAVTSSMARAASDSAHRWQLSRTYSSTGWHERRPPADVCIRMSRYQMHHNTRTLLSRCQSHVEWEALPNYQQDRTSCSWPRSRRSKLRNSNRKWLNVVKTGLCCSVDKDKRFMVSEWLTC